MHKIWLFDQMVNYIRFAWKLACMLRPYRTYNPTVGFSKYEYNNKLLDGVTVFKVTLSVTRTQPYIVRSYKISWWSKISSPVINQLSRFKFL